MRSPRLLHSLVALSLLGVAAGDASAQWLRIRPGMVAADDGVVPALRISIERESAGLETSRAFPREWAWTALVDAPLTWKADRNPESLRGEVRLGLEISLYKPPAPTPTPVPGVAPGQLNLGYVSLQLLTAIEALQNGDFVDFDLGGVFVYEHDQFQRLWFLPEARVAFGAVVCVSCPVPDSVEDTWHRRLDAEVGWNVPLDRGWVPAPLKPLWLRFRGRVFDAAGMPEALEQFREDTGLWGGAEIAYRFDRSDWLQEVYVRWSGGELPVRLADKSAWAAGITVAF